MGIHIRIAAALFLVLSTVQAASAGLFSSRDIGELASEIVAGNANVQDLLNEVGEDSANDDAAAIILTSTPEPSIYALTGLAALGGLGIWWRRRRLDRRNSDS